MAYQTLTQMTANMLDPVRGWWDERQLSRVCPVTASAEDLPKIVAGMVGYLDTNNHFAVGGGTGSRNKMPLFARGGALDNDSIRIEGNMASQRGSSTQGTPATVGTAKDVGISCLVGTGAYELGTTAFVTGIAAGDLLMADANSNFAASPTNGLTGKGKIAKFAATTTSLYAGSAANNTNQIVGVATSNSDVKNQYGAKMLYFYVNWWPAL
jgi:hypothetical protein